MRVVVGVVYEEIETYLVENVIDSKEEKALASDLAFDDHLVVQKVEDDFEVSFKPST